MTRSDVEILFKHFFHFIYNFSDYTHIPLDFGIVVEICAGFSNRSDEVIRRIVDEVILVSQILFESFCLRIL